MNSRSSLSLVALVGAIFIAWSVGTPACAQTLADGPRRRNQAPPTGHQWCGSGKHLIPHFDAVRRAALEAEPTKKERSGLRGSADRDLGEIAVLEDDGTLLDGVTVTNAIVQRFYESHPDYWDYVVLFNNAGAPAEFGLAFEFNIRGLVGGINYESFDSPQFPTGGYPTFNFTEILGVESENLDSVVNMSHLGIYDGPVGDHAILGYPGLYVLAHEASHQFGAFLLPDNAPTNDLVHWGFFYDSEASSLFGNRFHSDGNGNYTTVEGFSRLSQIDRYCWGLLPASEVTYPGFFLMNPIPNLPPSSFPQVGLTFSGERVDVTIDNYIAQNGPRVPEFSRSQKRFRFAFVLVVAEGTTPSQADLDEVNAFRTAWETYFALETDGKGIAETSLTTPRFSTDFQEGIAPFHVSFRNESYGEITSFLWDFGDGATSAEENPTHTYEEPGLYTVRLRVVSPSSTQTTTEVDFIAVGEQAPIFDDFQELRGWTVGDPADTATDGFWTLRDPNPIFDPVTRFVTQPGRDHTPGAGFRAYITGNQLQGFDGSDKDDVDGGVTSLRSPIFDLTRQSEATLVFYHYGYNRAMSPEDTFSVDLSSDAGQTWTTVFSTAGLLPAYRREVVPLHGILPFTDEMRLRFQARDDGEENEVETVLDDVAVLTTAPGFPRDCDLALPGAEVDYDPETPGVQSGPGFLGQAVSVVVDVRNDGLLPILGAELEARVTFDETSFSSRLTITDFDPNTPGDQALLPLESASSRIAVESGIFTRCGSWRLDVFSDPDSLLCDSGGGTIFGDEDPTDDLAPGGLTVRVDFGTLSLDVLPSSEEIESASGEKLRFDAALVGQGEGLPPLDVVFHFDVVEGEDPERVVYSGLRAPHPRTLSVDGSRSATVGLPVSVSPSLPRNVPLRLRITMVEVATEGPCLVGLSDEWRVTGE